MSLHLSPPADDEESQHSNESADTQSVLDRVGRRAHVQHLPMHPYTAASFRGTGYTPRRCL